MLIGVAVLKADCNLDLNVTLPFYYLVVYVWHVFNPISTPLLTYLLTIRSHWFQIILIFLERYGSYPMTSELNYHNSSVVWQGAVLFRISLLAWAVWWMKDDPSQNKIGHYIQHRSHFQHGIGLYKSCMVQVLVSQAFFDKVKLQCFTNNQTHQLKQTLLK